MKNTKTLSLLLAFVMLFSLLAGCGAKSGTDGKITVTDMKGRTIELDAPADKIVALTAADCEILCAIGAKDSLVGRGEYCDYPEEISSVPSVQSGSETNIEQIISLAPQVVLMDTMAQTTDQVQQLENAGIKVVVSEAADIDGVYTAIKMIGAVAGKNDEAEKLVSDMKTSFDSIKADAAAKSDGTEKSVYFEVSPLSAGLWTAGSGTFMDEIAAMLGLKNAFSDVSGWAEISQEQVIDRNPDYIVTLTVPDGTTDPADEICSRAGWETVSAVKGEAILDLPNNELTRPGPRLVDGAKALYNLVYTGE